MKKRLYYYVPGLTSMDRHRLADYGLGHLKGCGTAFRGTTAGPDKAAGVVFIPSPSGEELGAVPGYWPDKQEWHCCDAGRYWVGWNKDSRPGPEDLRKPVFRAQHEKLELADGNQWEFSAVAVLPLAFGLTPSGEFGGYRQPQNERYYEAALWVSGWITSAETAPFSEIVQRLSMLLSMNYWVGYWECLALRLFTGENLRDAACASLNVLGEWNKKKAELKASTFAESDSSDGLRDICLDTGPIGTTSSDITR